MEGEQSAPQQHHQSQQPVRCESRVQSAADARRAAMRKRAPEVGGVMQEHRHPLRQQHALTRSGLAQTPAPSPPSSPLVLTT
eukprot:492747-Rhodomonas_salina.3